MKRFACLLATVLLVFVQLPAFSEGNLDLSSMTLDELVALKNAVSLEISERTNEPITLFPGSYVAGEHIPAGEYSITCSEGSSHIQIYEAPDCSYNLEFNQRLNAGEFVQRIVLSEGHGFIIEGDALTFSTFAGIE